MLKRLLKDEEGATMTEYILLVVLIAVALIVVVKTFGTKIASLFKTSTSKIGETEGTSY